LITSARGPSRNTQKRPCASGSRGRCFHEYGISVDDMVPDFLVPVSGKRKRADIAIFKAGSEHDVASIRRIVIIRPEPKKNGHKGTTKLRNHDQASKDLDDLKVTMAEAQACEWGLRTEWSGVLLPPEERASF
jgi:type I restriction enzyme M protein